MICAALECTVADLMTAEPDAYLKGREQEPPRASAAGGGEARPVPRSGGGQHRPLPPN